MEQEEKKIKILLVDDDNFLLDMYALKFKQTDFILETALGPEQALKKLSDGFSPDFIALDVVMPVMDGFEMIEKIRSDNLAPNAKFIVLSNQGQESDIEKGKALGVSDYIIKANLTPSEVVSHIVTLSKK